MGNYKFRLSDMMPNAWFYKLKEIGTKNQNHNPKKPPTNPQSKPNQPGSFTPYPRKSYYITRELNSPNFSHDPPRKSSRRLRRRTGQTSRSSPKLVTSSVSAGCSCRATLWTKSDSPPDSSSSLNSDSSLESDSDPFPSEFRSDPGLITESFDKMVSLSQSKQSDSSISSYTLHSSGNEFDSVKKPEALLVLDAISDLNLAPLVTKPVKFDETEPPKIQRSVAKYKETNTHTSLSVKIVKEEKLQHKNNASYVKKHTTNTPGVRLRLNSPRIANRRFNQGRKSLSSTRSSRNRLSDSLAVVKASFDPQRDFRDSMMEMIVENNIRASKDLEDLLACYLSLNSDEYHDLIIKVFKQIWFDLTNRSS